MHAQWRKFGSQLFIVTLATFVTSSTDFDTPSVTHVMCIVGRYTTLTYAAAARIGMALNSGKAERVCTHQSSATYQARLWRSLVSMFVTLSQIELPHIEVNWIPKFLQAGIPGTRRMNSTCNMTNTRFCIDLSICSMPTHISAADSFNIGILVGRR